MQLTPPYAVYLGNATDILGLKMAASIAYWRPELCVGEIKGPDCTVSTGLQSLSLEEAAKAGAKTFVLGFNMQYYTIQIDQCPFAFFDAFFTNRRIARLLGFKGN